MKYLILSVLALILNACGVAESSTGVQVEIVTAPDGARCYVFVKDGDVKGGSCQN